QKRFERLRDLAQRHFSGAEMNGVSVRVRPNALRVEGKTFPVPGQMFGSGRALRVLSREQADGVELAELGKARMSHVLDPRCGLAVAGPFGSQYLLVPQSMPRPAAEDFKDRLEKTVRQIAQASFSLRTVLYQDGDARTLKQQVDAVTA